MNLPPLDRRHFAKTVARAALAGVCVAKASRADEPSAQSTLLPCAPPTGKSTASSLRATRRAIIGCRISCCAAEPLDADRWRLWYSINHRSIPAIFGIAEGIPGESMTRHEAVLSPGEPANAPLSIGNLPEGWRQSPRSMCGWPMGGIDFIFGCMRVRWCGCWLPIATTAGAIASSIHCVRALYHPNDRAVDGKSTGLSQLASKQAQLAAGEPAAVPSLISNDATNIYQLADRSFEMYTVALMEVGRDNPRLCLKRTTSPVGSA